MQYNAELFPLVWREQWLAEDELKKKKKEQRVKTENEEEKLDAKTGSDLYLAHISDHAD